MSNAFKLDIWWSLTLQHLALCETQHSWVLSLAPVRSKDKKCVYCIFIVSENLFRSTKMQELHRFLWHWGETSCFSEETTVHTEAMRFYKLKHLKSSMTCMQHAECEVWTSWFLSVLQIPVSPAEGEFAKADAVISGLYTEKAACKTCCLLLTCWAQSVHPQSTRAWGSRLAGSVWLPGARGMLASLPKSVQQLMSWLLATTQESISRKGLTLLWNET